MKTKVLSFTFLILTSIILTNCDDTISTVGMGIQPDEDKISIYDDSLTITARTVKVDSIYSKSINGYLGELYDPLYGTVKSGYACQFYPSNGFPLDSLVDFKVDSARLYVYYTTLGDSLTPMEVTVYPVEKPLTESYYSNIKPSDFCNTDNPLTKYGYIASNPYVSDSLVSLSYYRGLSIPLPREFGQRFMDEALKPEPNAFSSVDNFTEFFPGVYLESTFGSGVMLAVAHTRLFVYYKRNYTDSTSDGRDTIKVATTYADFRVTKEVIQLNSFENKNDEFLLEYNPEKSYVKSPGGVFTQLTIPLSKIKEGIGKRKFSGVSLSVKAYPKDDWEYGFPFPGTGTISNTMTKAKMLLIEPDSVKSFFEKQSIADSKTSYSTEFNTSSYSYTFSNISSLVQNAIEKEPEKDNLDLLLIPIITSYSMQSYNYSYYAVDYISSHYLRPSGVALRTGEEDLKIRVTATDLEINQ